MPTRRPSGLTHGWPSREQDVPFRFKAVGYLPHGTPDRYPAKPHDPEKRISRPGAASDSGRIGHFAGAAYAFRDIIAITRARAMGAEFATQFVLKRKQGFWFVNCRPHGRAAGG